MKKILICIPSLTNGDGIANFFMNYYNYVCNDGYRIDFFCVSQDEYSEKYLKRIEENKSKVYILPNYGKIRKYIKIKKFIEDILKKEKYDLIHINYVDVLAYKCVIAAKKNNVPSVLHIHNPRMIPKNIKEIIYEFYNSRAVKYCNNIVACSKNAAVSIKTNKKIQILYNKIDIEKFKFNIMERKNVRAKLNIKKDEKLIGIVARITEQKNPEFIINVANYILKKNKKYKFVWIGNGNMENYIQRKVKELKIENNFQFIDTTPQIEKYYGAMDLFFLPSLYEGFGYVFLEAQASGLNIILSDKVPSDVMILKENIKKIYIEKYNIEKCADEILKSNMKNEKERIEDNLKMQKCIYNIAIGTRDLTNYYNNILNKGENV